jgi:hypothetical protein
MTANQKEYELTEMDKYLIDLRADYDEQLKENEECRQRLGRYGYLGQKISLLVSSSHGCHPEAPPICTDFQVKITPYFMDENFMPPRPE